jgi:hypothetical protein
MLRTTTPALALFLVPTFGASAAAQGPPGTGAFGWSSPSIFGDSDSPVRVINKMLQIAGGWSLANGPICL